MQRGYGGKLATTRVEKGLGLNEVAEACGVSREKYIAIENSKDRTDPVYFKAMDFVKNYKPKEIKINSTAAYTRLANAIVLNAVEEWKQLDKRTKLHPRKLAIEDWIKSSLIVESLGLNGNSVVEALRAGAWRKK